MKKKSTGSSAKTPVRLRQKTLSNGNKSLYLDIYRKGKREYEFLRLYLVKAATPLEREQNRQTLATAEAIRAKRQIEIQNGVFGFSNEFKLDTFFLEYFRKLCDDRKSEAISKKQTSNKNKSKNRNSKSLASKGKYLSNKSNKSSELGSQGNWGTWNSCLRHLERYCSEQTTFRDITPNWIEGFKEYLNNAAKDVHKRKYYHDEVEAKPLSQNTKSTYFNRLRACLNQAYDDGIIPVNPFRGIKGIKKDETERVYLTLDEVKQLAKTECRYPPLKRAFLFSCLTGIRKSDIERLRWGDVQKFDKYTRLVFKQKKTGGQEYLDISKQAEEYLGERGQDADRVFTGFRYSSQMLLELRRWSMEAGITKDVTFHTGRHTFAVAMINLGTDIYTVSKLLGHKDISTTLIYTKVLDKKKQEAVDLFPNIKD